MANKCLLVEWFNYNGQCPITTCKFHTKMLESGCIAAERQDTVGKKFLTDRELQYYKFNNSITVNDVMQHRKKAMAKVKNVLAMYYYTQFLLNSCKMQQVVIPDSCAELLHKYPFRLSKICVTPILLGNMFIKENFEQYRKKVKLDGEYEMWDLFLMTRKKWETLYNDFINANRKEN